MNIIKRLIYNLGHLTSFILPQNMGKAFDSIRSAFYTGFHSRRFAYWGSNTTLRYRALKLLGVQYISVGSNTTFGIKVQLTAWKTAALKSTSPSIKIGSNCTIRDYAHITAVDSITIGDGLLTGTNILITDNAHGEFTPDQLRLPPTKRPIYSKGPVIIGNNVWLGNNVCVMPGVTIGDGAVIGANSIVTKDIPPYSMAAGVPASIIKRLEQ